MLKSCALTLFILVCQKITAFSTVYSTGVAKSSAIRSATINRKSVGLNTVFVVYHIMNWHMPKVLILILIVIMIIFRTHMLAAIALTVPNLSHSDLLFSCQTLPLRNQLPMLRMFPRK